MTLPTHASTPSVPDSRTGRLFLYYLIATTMICGSLVMVLEVLGSRVLGPFFGVSLFVWTSLITVTLVSLAAGYAAGGMLSDRRRAPEYLYGIILIAGFLVFAIPAAKGTILKMCLPWGLRTGALGSSTMLFGPPLFLLGCVSPYVVKIAAREMRNIGRTVGVFYALSTIGSFLGTVLTGFVFIAYLGVDRIFELAGFILVCLGLAYFILFRRTWLLLGLLAVPYVLFPGSPSRSAVLPDGTRVSGVFSQDSFYGNLKVIDYSYGSIHTRELVIDGLVQGGIDVNNGMSVYEYAYLMELLPYRLNPGGKNCLVIGLGAGVIPRWYESKGIKTDVVDIDPNVPRIARKYFGFAVSGDVIISDARYFLEHSRKRYDYIVLDVFNGDTTPGHLLSLEALRLAKDRMNPDGILAINLVGSLRQRTFMTASIVKTLNQVFDTVDIYPVFSLENGNGWGNIAVMAYEHSSGTSSPIATGNHEYNIHPMARAGVFQALAGKFAFPPGTPSIILTDDYNPIDFFDSWLKEDVRKEIIKTTAWNVLL